MISINNLTVSFGSWELFSRINFHITESDKIGLVGKNGGGQEYPDEDSMRGDESHLRQR